MVPQSADPGLAAYRPPPPPEGYGSAIRYGVPMNRATAARYGFHVLDVPVAAVAYRRVIVALAFVASVAWFAWRARRAGSPVSVSRVAWVAAIGSVAMAFGYFVQGMDNAGGAELVGPVVGSLAALGLCASAWAYFRLGPGRRVAAVVGGLGLAAAACATAAVLLPDLVDVLIVAVGLLALAWWERTWLPAVVGLDFGLATWLSPEVVPGLLAGASVLLVGAIGALVLRASQSGAGAPWTMAG